MSKIQKSNNEKFDYILIFLFILLLTYFLNWGIQGDFFSPLIYSGDGVAQSTLIKRVLEGNLYETLRSGYPFGSELYDFSIPDLGNILIFWFLSFLKRDFVFIYNAYYLVSFPLAALSSYFVLRKFGSQKLAAFCLSALFAFLPFHFLRIAHLHYMMYFVAPIFVWIAWRLYQEPDFFQWKARRELLSIALLLMVISSFGVYYAVFGVITFLLAGLLSFFEGKGLRVLSKSLVLTGVVFLTILLNTLPNLVYKAKYGPNPEVAKRSPVESEIYGLKLIQLVLPRSDHRLSIFSRGSTWYARNFHLVNENSTASLGLIGSLGFIICLIYILFRPRWGAFPPWGKFLAFLVICYFIITTIGGFSSIFALLVSPMIRAWNRISVFIGFCSLGAVASMFKSDFLSSRLVRFLSIFILSLGVWDQSTSVDKKSRAELSQTFKEDAAFFKEIERLVGEGAVYQIPYMPFPESIPVVNLPDYEHFKAFIHTTKTKWSYGAMKGREGDRFFRELAQKNYEEQFSQALKMGFNGVLVNMKGLNENDTKYFLNYFKENRERSFWSLREDILFIKL